jgi:hypothetical protein
MCVFAVQKFAKELQDTSREVSRARARAEAASSSLACATSSTQDYCLLTALTALSKKRK